MANSKLLKQAIADAKAVKETALANAKLALEEAFTPRLQSVLTQKLRAEAEEAEDEEKMKTEELDSSEIGSGDLKEPSGYEADTEVEGGVVKTTSDKIGSELDDYQKVKDLTEEEEMEDDEDDSMSTEYTMEDDMMGDDDDYSDDEEGEDYMPTGDEEEDTDDEMDLEAIIRELESQLGEEEQDEESAEDEMEPKVEGDESPIGEPETAEEEDDVIDLEEILREMEADMKDGEEEEKMKTEAEEEKKELEKDLEEAYKTIKSLQSTINEVNLLNAKLLFANKLFRAHNMTNEQKVKVIETLDRTKSVREVKLVYSTLAENFKYTSNSSKVAKKSITEGIASKAVKSTKPAAAAQKQVIAENADFANRFKKLAGIIK